MSQCLSEQEIECIHVKSAMPIGLLRAICGERFRNNEQEGETKDLPDEHLIGIESVFRGPRKVLKYATWAMMKCVPKDKTMSVCFKHYADKNVVVTELANDTILDIDQLFVSYPHLVNKQKSATVTA